MPLRVLNYAVQAWLRHCDQKDCNETEEEGAALPLLVPLVITHAKGGWNGPRTFFELFEPHPTSIPELAPLIPCFSLSLLDLAHLSNEELKARALDAFPKLALWLLRDARDATRLFANLGFWASTFRQALATPSGIEAVSLLLRYIYWVCTPLQAEDFRETIRKQLPEAEQAAMTIAEQLHEEGRQIGREEGREEGLQKALRSTLSKQLKLKFGALAAGYAERLDSASTNELEQYLERIVTASTIEAVFAAH